jgi:hypothetical protein
MRLDGEDNKYTYVTALKYEKYGILANKKCIECRSNSQFGQNNSSSKNIIFVLATDIISNDIQINIFNEIKNICESRGLNVLIKNHPNSNFRLPCPTDWQSLSPYIPFEVLELPYLLKIGLFSTTLTFQSEKSLSIVNLIDNISLDMKKRIKHNCVLLDSEIFSPNSFKEFELVIDKILSNEAN